MRQKRAKTYKRLMALYVQTYNFRQPFQILISDDLIKFPATASLDIHKALSLSVQGEIKPMITQCCIESLYTLGKEYQNLVNIAKTFERRKCNHREPLSPNTCLQDVIGASNKHRYVLASQSPKLRRWAEDIPGLPIIHFNPRGVLVLSPPSVATTRDKNQMEEERRVEGGIELEGLKEGGNVIGAEMKVKETNLGKRSRAKEPNPLSQKKKKAIPSVQKSLVEIKRKTVSEGPELAESDEGEKAGDGDEGGDTARRKKKRKRRGKGVVAAAIAEIRADAAKVVAEAESDSESE